MKTFAEWLQAELKQRGLSQADLARSLGFSTAHINRLYQGVRTPSADMCHAIAKVFGLPVETVFRAANILPDKRPITDQQEQLLHVFNQLDERGKREVLEIVKALRKAKGK